MLGQLDVVVPIFFNDGTESSLLLGTGLVVAPNRILTCKHVTQKLGYDQHPIGDYVAEQLSIRRAGSALAITRIEPHPDIDLALLSLDSSLDITPATFVRELTIDQIDALEACALTACGYPQDGDQLTQKTVTPPLNPETNGDHIIELQPSGGVKEGGSGGPLVVFRQDQAVVVGLNHLGGIDANFSRTIAADPILAFLRAHGLNPPTYPAKTLLPETLRANQRARPKVPDDNPYQSLSAFTEDDSDRFFGREAITEKLHEQLADWVQSPNQANLLALLGPSGSGKSSLARAGLLARFQTQPLVPHTDRPLCGVFRPGNRPLEKLAYALAQIATADKHPPLEDVKQFEQDLQNADGLRRIASSMGRDADSDRAVILLIDQFEQVYSQCDRDEDRDTFVENIVQAMIEPGPLVIILTLRSDFLGATQQHQALNHLIAAHTRIVPSLTTDELHAAIAQPAADLGYPLESGLVQTLVEQSQNRNNVLPLLQFTLSQLWEGMKQGQEPLQVLTDLGGVGGALAHQAQTTFDKLNNEQQAITRRIFLSLVQLGEGVRDTTRRVAVEEFIAAHETDEQVRNVLDRFSHWNIRLISLSGDEHDGKKVAEITHEALLEHWGQLRTWLTQHRDDERFRRRLSDAAKHWDAQNRDADNLWRRRDLESLAEFAQRHPDLTERQQAFFNAAQRQHRRRWWLNRGAVALLAVLTVGLAVVSWQMNRAQQEALMQAEEAERQREHAEIMRREAERQGERAERQREQAERRFGQLADLANTFIFEFHDEVKDLTGSTPARERVARKGAELLQLLAQDKEDDLNLMRDLAVSYFKLGDIDITLGQVDHAFENHQAALELFKDIRQKNPNSAQAQRDLSVSYERIGNIKAAMGDTQGALAEFQNSLKIALTLADADPNSAQAQRDLSVSYERIGNIKAAMGDTQGALAEFQNSLKIRIKLADADPNSAQAQRDLSVSYNKVGDIKAAMGDTQGALAEFQNSLKIALTLADADPNSAQAQRDLSVSYDQIGNIKAAMGDTQGALAEFQNSLKIALTLADADPNSAQAQRDLSVSYDQIGNIKAAMGDTQGALAEFQNSLKIALTLADADPNSAQAQRDLSVSYDQIGNIKAAMGDTQGALAEFQNSLKIALTLADADPNSAQAQRDLSVSYERIGNIKAAMGDTQGALAEFQNSLKIRIKLADADPNSAQAQRDLSVSYNKVGDIKAAMGDTQGALAEFQNSLKIRIKLADADPNSAQAQRDLSVSYDQIGNIKAAMGDTQGALAEFQNSLKIALTLADADPNSAQAQRDLSVSYKRIGNIKAAMGDTQGALAEFQNSLKIALTLADADPNSAQAQRDLSVSYERIGNIKAAMGDTQGALAEFQNSLKIRIKLADADPNSAQAQRDLSVSYDQIGNIKAAMGDTQGALAEFQNSLKIRIKLADADPNSAQAQRDLSVSYDQIGNIKAAMGDTQGALAEFQNSLKIRIKLADADPNSAQAQRDFFVSLAKIGFLHENKGDIEGALDYYQRAVAVIQPLAEKDTLNRQYQNDYEWILERLRTVSSTDTQSSLLENLGAFALSVADQLVEQASQLAKNGHMDQALDTFHQTIAIKPALKENVKYWNTFCWYGGLHQQAQKALPHCDQAVTLSETDGEIRDSRAIVRTLSGDLQGAIADFQFYLDWAPQHDHPQKWIDQRQQWVDALKAGKNPFTPAVLEQLRTE